MPTEGPLCDSKRVLPDLTDVPVVFHSLPLYPCRCGIFITARKRSLRRLCFYRCLSVHRGEGACVVAGGGMRGCRGACMVARGYAWLWGVCMVAGGHAWLLGAVCGYWGHVWLLGSMCGCWGVCMVAGGYGWLLGGMHGCQGACMVAGGMHGCWGRVHRYNKIRSMSGRYASYWNAFLLKFNIFFMNTLMNVYVHSSKSWSVTLNGLRR